MESLDRQNNRLISSLIDLKLESTESTRPERILEEVLFLLPRGSVSQERLEFLEVFTRIKFMKNSSKLRRKTV